ncbi:DUF983 domain-containing protein [Acidiphilium sp. AL]|uniref:DUF983 domain-containing protein n=1 Tax=Acidiphilium iwatense TaxID=768198 RepID=A0ABS9DU68_9PROT|nr:MULTISPECIES: DUF983 domain-containing protein [Acidiphilium]MCF3946237.1 DUF983 domain-containing protein [Acidiphilium iwatense]MCU4158809.1 DUF983 domain-containing protein [Acidiphilium sp. AL]
MALPEGIQTLSDDMPTEWTPNRAKPAPVVAMPGWVESLRRGLAMRCPACGEAPAFQGYLKVTPACPHCAAPLGRVPCDDAPPYITLLLALHVVVLIIVLSDAGGSMTYITSLVIFVPLTIVLELVLLRPVKGATLAVMLKVNLLRRDAPAAKPTAADHD